MVATEKASQMAKKMRDKNKDVSTIRVSKKFQLAAKKLSAMKDVSIAEILDDLCYLRLRQEIKLSAEQTSEDFDDSQDH